MKLLTAFAVATLFCASCKGQAWTDAEETADFWIEEAMKERQYALNEEKLNTNVARNVIMFLGDGMGVPSITAGRILKGQLQGKSGEETVSAMDSLPHHGFSKTYAIDRDGTDSACSATAYLCGVKGRYSTIGVSGQVYYKDCESWANGTNDVESVLMDSARAGKSTGLVTTTRIHHASPAATFGHTPYRSWYADDDLNDSARKYGCKDLAQQFYDQSDKITVALGGGREYFTPEGTYDVEYPTKVQNNREDGQDLIQMWQDKHGENAHYVWNKTAFEAIDPVKTEKLLGMFEPGDLNFDVDRSNPAYEAAGEPSLAEMAEKAIQILQKNPEGYFLFVEGGRIDHAHHGSSAYNSLTDWVAFDEAIQKALDMTSESDTLIVVTADHSHTFMFGGYGARGNPLFGLDQDGDEPTLAADGKPFTTLVYGNGDGYQKGGEGYDSIAQFIAPQTRANLTGVDLAQSGFLQQSAAPIGSETHGAEDVAIFARGPMAHLIHKTHEQSYIAYMMRYASCVGSDLRHCEKNAPATDAPSSTTAVPIATPIAASFLGLDLTVDETEWALYVQFILCISLFLCLLNSIVVCGKTRKASKAVLAAQAKANGSYQRFEEGKL